MKFRVERDALAERPPGWPAACPTGHPVPVLAGVLLARQPTATCCVSGLRLRGLQPGDLRGAAATPRRRARLRPPARRDHQGAAGQAGRHRRGRRTPRAGLRQRPVHPADHAGRGLPRAAGDAAERRHRRRRDVRPGGRPGGHRRRPRRDAADDDRRPPRARRAPADAARHRPVPAGAARDPVAPGGRRADQHRSWSRPAPWPTPPRRSAGAGTVALALSAPARAWSVSPAAPDAPPAACSTATSRGSAALPGRAHQRRGRSRSPR